ncbi:oligogalacturonide transporter [Clostridium acidisoli DSM 12555]|uniref:Oligogalacturonide transporter n=1 Tax=Clostridium acidisoli DSM 12555 TaxID=1121291 RepID=A0A1W1XDG1_9CLOT|nr:MFS transporter [Clostridium acidisoli]SMC21923.1 oligogalacturonide transporter [Clostridium acidisoli DSM 12555]
MSEKIKLRNIFGYASINFLGSGAQGLISAWLMFFYTSVCGISAVKAGFIFGAVRLIDALGNPILGFISDAVGQTKFGKKYGRRKPFIAVGIIGVALVFPSLWIAEKSFAYYLIVNFIYEISYTLIFVPGTTLPAEMTQNAAEKAKLIGGKQYCGTISGIITGFLTAYIFSTYGKTSAKSFWYIGLIYGIITTIFLIFFILNVYERDPKDIVYEDAAGSFVEVFKKLGTDIFSSMRNRAFRLHTIMWFLGSVFKQLSGGVFTYFAVFVVLVSTVTVSSINSTSSIISCVALFVYILLAYKFGGPKTYKIGSAIVFVGSAGYLLLALIGHSSITVALFVIFAIINIIGKTSIDYVPTYQMGFIADIDEAITGKRREGVYNGVNGLFGKVASAIEPIVLGIVLGVFGFKSGKNVHVQPHGAVIGICVVAIVVPVVLLLITWVAASRFKLTKETHKLLVDEVNRVHAGGSKADVTPEAKAAIEELTGWKYEQCFGNNNVSYKNNKSGHIQAKPKTI